MQQRATTAADAITARDQIAASFSPSLSPLGQVEQSRRRLQAVSLRLPAPTATPPATPPPPAVPCPLRRLPRSESACDRPPALDEGPLRPPPFPAADTLSSPHSQHASHVAGAGTADAPPAEPPCAAPHAHYTTTSGLHSSSSPSITTLSSQFPTHQISHGISRLALPPASASGLRPTSSARGADRPSGAGSATWGQRLRRPCASVRPRPHRESTVIDRSYTVAVPTISITTVSRYSNETDPCRQVCEN